MQSERHEVYIEVLKRAFTNIMEELEEREIDTDSISIEINLTNSQFKDSISMSM